MNIAFENGVIKDIIVRASASKTFSYDDDKANKKTYTLATNDFKLSNLGYIPVRNGHDIDNISTAHKNYLSFLYSKDSLVVVDLSEVINYNRTIHSGSGNYIPVDTILTLSDDMTQRVKLFKPKISESVDIRLYTDALAYGASKTPNGLVQSETQLFFNLNQGKNRFKLFKIWKQRSNILHRRQLLVLNYISPYFKFTKIENNKNSLHIDPTGEIKKNMLDIFKYSHLNVGTELNLITYRTDSKVFTHNINFGILRTKVGNDSVPDKNITLSSAYVNPNFDFRFFESSKIDFNIRTGIYVAKTLSPIDTLTISSKKTRVNSFINTSDSWWMQFQQSINLHPGGNKQSSIFLRASQYYGLLSETNFFSFQVGYSSSLDNLLKF